jgi:hypothetical protein
MQRGVIVANTAVWFALLEMRHRRRAPRNAGRARPSGVRP